MWLLRVIRCVRVRVCVCACVYRGPHAPCGLGGGTFIEPLLIVSTTTNTCIDMFIFRIAKHIFMYLLVYAYVFCACARVCAVNIICIDI